jgi:hypothetical protein
MEQEMEYQLNILVDEAMKKQAVITTQPQPSGTDSITIRRNIVNWRYHTGITSRTYHHKLKIIIHNTPQHDDHLELIEDIYRYIIVQKSFSIINWSYRSQHVESLWCFQSSWRRWG